MRFQQLNAKLKVRNAPIRTIVMMAWLGSVTLALTAGARAGPLSVDPFWVVDEFRLGVLAANLEGGGAGDSETAINGEVLFDRFDGQYTDPLHDMLFRPRFHVGASIGPDDGVSQAYFGLTWDYQLGERLFVESSFGGVVHNGPTDADDTDSYGCTIQFRESASIGVELTDQVRLMATVDHMSNAGLCDQNQGLTIAGVGLGYRW